MKQSCSRGETSRVFLSTEQNVRPLYRQRKLNSAFVRGRRLVARASERIACETCNCPFLPLLHSCLGRGFPRNPRKCVHFQASSLKLADKIYGAMWSRISFPFTWLSLQRTSFVVYNETSSLNLYYI